MKHVFLHETMKEAGIVAIQLVLTTLLILGIDLALNGGNLVQVNLAGFCLETLVLNAVVFLCTYSSKKIMDECEAYLSMQ